MAENKQYITQAQENGTVMISEEVLGAIVVNSLHDVEGVVAIGSKLSADLNSIKNWAKSLKISISENNEVCVDCSIIVAYGQSVIVVAKNAQDTITAAIESTTGVKPTAVNVSVCGIAHQ